MAANDYAIVVGIDSYPGEEGIPGLPRLEASERDARKFEEWLLDPAGGAVPRPRVKTAMSSDVTPGEPSWGTVNRPFRELANETLRTGRIGPVGRRLYIFLAGHGFSDPQEMNTAALLSAEASYFYTPHVAGRRYAEWFRRNGAFEEIVLVMDCCRELNDLMGLQDPPFPKTKNTEEARRVRFFYAYATEWGQTTRETLIDGEVCGIFTKSVLDALRNAPPDESGRVTGQRVKDYIHNRITELMNGAGAPAPQIDIDSQRDIVFAERDVTQTRKVSVVLDPFVSGMTVAVIDAFENLVMEVETATPIVVLDLPPGIYKVVAAGTRSEMFELVGQDEQQITI